MKAVAGAGEHVVVVVAHPDDETFGCGSLIALAADAGASVTVVCATRGELGERRSDPATDRLPLAEVRERELRVAASVLGARTVEVLDHRDSGFDGPLPDGALCATPVDRFGAELATIFARLVPDVVVVLQGDDGHRDHQHVREAAVLARSDRPHLRLVHVCLANSLMRRWAEEMRAQRPDTAYLQLDIEHLGTPDAELIAVDASAVLDIRERAISCHRSQASPFDGLSPELRRAFLSTDHLRLGPAQFV